MRRGPKKIQQSKVVIIPKTLTTVPATSIADANVTSATEKQEEEIELDFVTGLETCKEIPSDHECKKLCEIIEKSYKSISNLSTTPYWIAGGILAVLTLISIVLFIKMCEMKQDHSDQLDLSGLSQREEMLKNLHAEPTIDFSKFKNRGGVLIATNIDDAFKKTDSDPDKVEEMGNVLYDEAENELYDFGVEFDRFEPSRENQSKTSSISKPPSKSKPIQK